MDLFDQMSHFFPKYTADCLTMDKMYFIGFHMSESF